jgi:2'-5' RNA ligase
LSDPDRVRLFTALWPDPAARAQLAALRDAWSWSPSARPVADANLHATLHFIGAFPRDSLVELGAALATVPVEPVPLRTSGSEVFRGGIAVALLEAEPSLLALHARVGEVLAGFGVTLEARPYRPHVTLARKAGGSRSPARVPALAWRADGFALVRSRGGSYEVLATLGAGFA